MNDEIKKSKSRLKRLINPRTVTAAGALVILLIVVRYFFALVGLLGLTSPLTYNATVAHYVIAEAVAWDLYRVRLRIGGLVGPPMENENFGRMSVGVTAEVLAPRIDREPAGSDDFVVLQGLAGRPGGNEAVALGRPEDRDGVAVEAEWTTPSGNDWATKHSLSRLIDRDNVAQLELVHEFDAATAFGGAWVSNSESPPLSANGVVYWISAGEYLVATHLVTGDELWHLRLPAYGYSRRGFVLHEPGQGESAVLFVPFGPFIVAVNADDGGLVKSFADGGVLTLSGPTLISPIVHDGQLIVGGYDPQVLTAFDINTGESTWSLLLHGAERNFDGGAPWSGMAIDRERSLLFVTTGNPRPPLSGITRPGNNENSNSVVAIDLNRHEIEWAFQEVRHDLWDFDIPSGPILTTIDVDERSYDVVIAVTKIGNTLVLDRASGEPIFDFRLGRAPTSSFLQEQVAEYQPDLELPEPLIEIGFDPSMVTDLSPEKRAFVQRQIDDGRTVYGRFEPPALNKDLISFGLHGGAEWHGASVNGAEDRLFVAVNEIPWVLRVYLTAGTELEPPDHPGAAVYTERCQSCHLANRDGEFFSSGEAATVFIPSLHGLTLDESNRASFAADHFASTHESASAAQRELDTIWDFFGVWDRELLEAGELDLVFSWRQLLDEEGLWGSVPPWGKIVALDLGTGRKAWEVPFGEKTIDGTVRQTGSASYGGLISTAGGVIFATGTDDGYLRAIDQETGETLWQYRMSAAGSAPPITVEYEGRQYVCVISTGGKFHNFVDQASKLYVFSLPE